MTELEQIAASVAKALGVAEPEYCADVFDPDWQARCRDWLVKNGYSVEFWPNEKNYFLATRRLEAEQQTIECPASEFCARAIHQLMQDTHGPL